MPLQVKGIDLLLLKNNSISEILFIVKLSKELTSVTNFSKYLAMVLFILFPIAGFLLGMQYASISFLASFVQAGLISIGFIFLMIGLIGAGGMVMLQIITMLDQLLPLIEKITDMLKTLKAKEAEKKLTIMGELPGKELVPAADISGVLEQVANLIEAFTKAPTWLSSSIIGAILILLGTFIPRLLQ